MPTPGKFTVPEAIRQIRRLYLTLAETPMSATGLGKVVDMTTKSARLRMELMTLIYGVRLEYDESAFVWRITHVPDGVDALIRQLSEEDND